MFIAHRLSDRPTHAKWRVQTRAAQAVQAFELNLTTGLDHRLSCLGTTGIHHEDPKNKKERR